LLRNGEGNAIARGDFASGISQYRKRGFAVTAWQRWLGSSLRRKSDKRCAEALDFRAGRRKRVQFEEAEGAPITPEKTDDDRPAFEKIRKGNETAAPASEPEQRRRLAGLYSLSDEAGFRERLDRAPRGINHLWFNFRLVFATACVKLGLQRHRTAPDKRGGTPGAFLIPADLRHPSRGNIIYSEGE